MRTSGVCKARLDWVELLADGKKLMCSGRLFDKRKSRQSLTEEHSSYKFFAQSEKHKSRVEMPALPNGERAEWGAVKVRQTSAEQPPTSLPTARIVRPVHFLRLTFLRLGRSGGRSALNIEIPKMADLQPPRKSVELEDDGARELGEFSRAVPNWLVLTVVVG